jgi:hypothetical protein
MTRKNIGWIALGTFAFAVLIGAICGRETPESADASPSLPTSPQVTPDNTQGCQAVIRQIITIQQTVISQKHSGDLLATPFDTIVARESQIDTSQCPADFRAAMTHFVAAETIASFNARMDRTGELDRALTAIVETSSTYGFAAPRALAAWDAYGQSVPEDQKQDFANIQSALVDLADVASKYGAK